MDTNFIKKHINYINFQREQYRNKLCVIFNFNRKTFFLNVDIIAKYFWAMTTT